MRRPLPASGARLRVRLRRHLLARLIDRDVLTMRHRRVAVGDDEGVEFDEAVAFLFVIGGDVR